MFIILSFLLGNLVTPCKRILSCSMLFQEKKPLDKILLFGTKEIVILLFSQKGRYSLIPETKFPLFLFYLFSSVVDKVLCSLSVALSSYQHSSVKNVISEVNNDLSELKLFRGPYDGWGGP